MTVRPDIAELLHAGYGDRTIARQTSVTQAHVAHARAILGLPKARGGIKPAATPEDLYWRRVKHADNGHLEWTGHRNSKGTPVVFWGGRGAGRQHTAYRLAYRIRHGHEPAGYAYPSCEHPGCVAPNCVADSAVTPRRGHHHAGRRHPNGDRDTIIRLIRDGGTNKGIARQLHTDPQRVARIRGELGAEGVRRPASLEERWAAHTQPAHDRHLLWTGTVANGVPVFTYRRRTQSARRVAFRMANGRDPQGHVKAGCDVAGCVAPACMEDQAMRDQYNAIFGVAA